MCGSWQTYSLRKQLLISFGSLTTVSLALIIITTVVFLNVTTSHMKTLITDDLLSQSKDNIHGIVTDSSNLFDKRLDKAARNNLDVFAFAAEDIFRSDYPFGQIQSYYNWNPFMKQPLVSDVRYHGLVSYGTGDYLVAGQTPYTQSSFDVNLNDTISSLFSVQPIMETLYFENSEFISNYLALDQTGAFTEYPGVTNGNYTQLIDYDPRQDPWYNLAKDTQQTTMYTDSYVDVWLNQVMITIVRSIQNVNSGVYEGSAGADMLTQTLQQSISDIKYLANGRTVLFESSTGNIIADSDQGNNQITQLYNYKQLTGIVISDTVWNQMIASPNTYVELDNYYVESRILNTGNQQFMISSFVYKKDVSNTLTPILSSIDSIVNVNGIIIGVVFAVVSIIVILTTLKVIDWIYKPIHKLTEETNQIMGNYGGNSNIYTGVQVIEINNRVAETAALYQEFRNMVVQQQQKQEPVNPGVVANNYYNPQHVMALPPSYIEAVGEEKKHP